MWRVRSLAEVRTQYAFKGKREHIAKVNIPNIAYLDQHIDTKIPHCLKDHVIVTKTIKITLNLDNELEQRKWSISEEKGINSWFRRN